MSTYRLDLHFHSHYSDGLLSPEELVSQAVEHASDIKALALTDHNTVDGVPRFMRACAENGITGFVSMELGGAHPGLPDTEFHFLLFFGDQWDGKVEERIAKLIPYFNRQWQIDTANMLIFLNAAAARGVVISYADVIRHSISPYINGSEPRDPLLIQPPSFRHIRELMMKRGMGGGDKAGVKGLEKSIWLKSGAEPLCSPFITEAYDAIRQSGATVILAHPSYYKIEVAKLRPLIEEWMRELGLVGLETHYGGECKREWKALADELGLINSCGSDSHSDFSGIMPNGKPAEPGMQGYAKIPVATDDEIDFEALISAISG